MIRYKLPDTSMQLLLHRDLMQQIEQLAKLHYPNEFGGIFIGQIVDNGITARIEQILIPKHYQHTSSYFKRFSKDLNEQLKTIFETSQGKRIYLGEWHTHPDGLAIPSEKDYATMLALSKNSEINIQTPVLLIYALNESVGNASCYILKEKKLQMYVEEV